MPPFLLRPRWVVGHVLVATLTISFVLLGLWQLRRLEERREVNATVVSRADELHELSRSAFDGKVGEAQLEYRRVRLTGTFDSDNEVLVRFETHQGQPGFAVVTPLVTEDGVALVERGWVPNGMGEDWPVADSRPPSGEVEVEGILVRKDGGELRLDEGGEVLVVSALDPAALAEHLPYERILPTPLLAVREAGSDSYPIPPEAPDLGQGPHLSYAIQWFSFATIVSVGWSVLLVRTGRKFS
jgi:surfeit locus 1 family protein